MDHGPDKGDDERDGRRTPSRPEPSAPPPAASGSSAPRRPPRSPRSSRSCPPAHITPDTSTHGSVRILEEPTPRPDTPRRPTTSRGAAARPNCPTGPSRPPGRSRPCWPATTASPAASSRRPGARRTPTGRPTRRSSSRRCSATSRPRSGRSTSPDERRTRSPALGVRPRLGPARTARTRGVHPTPSPSRVEIVSSSDEPMMPRAPVTAARPRPRRRRGRRRGGDARPCPSRRWPGRRRHLSPRAGRPARSAPVPPAAAAAVAGEPSTTRGRTGVRPSGTPRVGRARRSGLLPGPPEGEATRRGRGAGGRATGRRAPRGVGGRCAGCRSPQGRTGGLAAADRAAGRTQPRNPWWPKSRRTTRRSVRGSAARRARRRSPDRPPRSSSNYTPEVTGGGPPAPPAGAPTPRRRGGRRQYRPPGRHRGGGRRRRPAGLQGRNGHRGDPLASSSSPSPPVRRSPCCGVPDGARPPCSAWSGTISLMLGAYNKGVAALPLVLVLITAFTLLWYLFGVERGSAVAGTASTLLVVGWVGLLGFLRRPPALPVAVPRPSRHRLPPRSHHRHRGQRRRGPRGGPLDRQPAARARTSVPTRPGRAWPAAPWPRSWCPRSSSGPSIPGRRPTPPCSAWWSRWWHRSATCASRCSSATSNSRTWARCCRATEACSTGSTPSIFVLPATYYLVRALNIG